MHVTIPFVVDLHDVECKEETLLPATALFPIHLPRYQS